MNAIHVTALVLISTVLLITSGCADRQQPRAATALLSDQYVGLSEEQLAMRLGPPGQVALLRGRQLLTEQHWHFAKTLPSPRLVKQQTYHRDGRRIVVLLIKNKGKWIVGSDSDVPENVVF